jgi:two-component system, OmpR family, heavy metal sensor histidine kinase CusS
MNRGLRPGASLALRIALASALFGLVVVGSAIVLGYWALSQQLDARSADEMRGRQELLVHILSDTPSMKAVAEPGPRFADLFFGHDDLHLALVTPEGTVLASFSEVASHSVTALQHAAAQADVIHSWRSPDRAHFSGVHGTARLANGEALEYFLSVDRERDVRLLAGFIKATLVALPLLLLVVALGAGLIAKTGMAPLRSFNRLAASIGTKSLDRRVSMAGLPRELVDMAVEFNGMLDRIDDGYRQLQDFSSDLAHEMRTPVATLLGRTQVALSQQRSGAELREVLEGNVEELDRLTTLISDMLFIARAEHNAVAIQPETVDLAQEARRVAEYMSLVAEEKGVALEVTGGGPPVVGDRLLVQRAITNLVSNAIRHAFARSTVEIEVRTAGPDLVLSVTNRGDAIAEANLERIFDRFYRADPGRGRLEGGSGLGLAIVRSIAKAHQGSVTVESGSGKTMFTLSFPLQAVDPAGTPGHGQGLAVASTG